jgi:hypothetical protein
VYERSHEMGRFWIFAHTEDVESAPSRNAGVGRDRQNAKSNSGIGGWTYNGKRSGRPDGKFWLGFPFQRYRSADPHWR